MLIVVTGAAGDIGSALVPTLRRNGHQVRPIVRRLSANTDPDARVSTDLVTEPELAKLVAGSDVVINLAAEKPSKSLCSSSSHLNARFPLRLAEAAQQAGTRFFIQLSSAATVGRSASNKDAPATDASSCEPSNEYGRQKLVADQELSDFQYDKLPIAILRPPAIFGPNTPGVFRPLLMAARYGLPLPFATIDNARSMIFLDNLCDAIAATINKRLSGTYIVTDSPPISIGALYREMLKAFGRGNRLFPLPLSLMRKPANILLGDRAESLFETSALDGCGFSEAADWRPLVAFEDALRAMTEGFKIA